MNFAQVRVLVVGDVMLDAYVSGLVQRISPEAPVPVLSVQKRWEVPGGAANVARNLARLGVDVALVGLVGRDADADALRQALDKEGIAHSLASSAARRTTRKVRLLAQGQQLLRLDEEIALPPGGEELESMAARVRALLPGRQAVVLSDYAKGVLLAGAETCLCRLVMAEAAEKGIPVLVDPKGVDWERYAGAQCVTPNAGEFATVCGCKPDTDLTRPQLETLADDVCARYHVERVLVTRGAKGMALLGGKDDPEYCRAAVREVADVSGAGDTVIALLAACAAKGLPWKECMRVANAAAGVVVGKMGTASVTLAELHAALREDSDNPKLYALPTLLDKVEDWRRKNESVVFTNGCFDLLHPGHVSLIRQSAAQGDHLVVGLNSDASVRRLKGPSRPIQNERARALLLAALSGVDAVVLFDEDTPINLVKAILPDVLVKGSDYRLEDVVGADVVVHNGGRVYLADLVSGCSTTGIVRKIDQGKQEQ